MPNDIPTASSTAICEAARGRERGGGAAAEGSGLRAVPGSKPAPYWRDF